MKESLTGFVGVVILNVQSVESRFTAEEKVKAGIDPSMAAELNRREANTRGVWNNPPPRPWYGR